MRPERICYFLSCFLAAMSITAIAVGTPLADYWCYPNEVPYWQHPCACAITTDPTKPEIHDFCTAAIPQEDGQFVDGKNTPEAPTCATCAEETCDDTPSLPCSDRQSGDRIWNCEPNKCNEPPVRTDWTVICEDTDKLGGCEDLFGCPGSETSTCNQ